MTGGVLRDVFGDENGDVKQIGDIVSDFFAKKGEHSPDEKLKSLYKSLSISFGTLTAKTIKTLSDEVKIAMAVTVSTLQRMPKENRNWDNVLSSLSQNPILERDFDIPTRVDRLVKNTQSYFRTNGSPDDAVVQEVAAWYQKFIGSSEVMKETKIDINVLGRVVAQSGATIDSFLALFEKSEKHEDVIDVTVLRLPDVEHPYIKLYRLKFTAWSDCTRILFVQEDANGISGEFTAVEFRPRKEVIGFMQEAAQEKLIAFAEDLL